MRMATETWNDVPLDFAGGRWLPNVIEGRMRSGESMSAFVEDIMFAVLAQAVLFRGAGLAVIWPRFIALLAIGAVVFAFSLARFRKTLATLA
jgi:ABC-2 type transport system permease protein